MCSVVINPQNSIEMAKIFPCALLEEIPDAGHLVLLEKKDAVMTAIKRWYVQIKTS
jgi:pimeloyl-ACP methyl ester carboxylesterase